MPNFAVLNNNIVVNRIVADSKEIAQQFVGLDCVEYLDENPLEIGYIYDGENFNAPNEEL